MRNKDKRLYISKYDEASKGKHTQSVYDLINSHVLVKSLKSHINTCNRCIKAITRFPASPDADRLIAGFEVYKAQCEHKLYKLESEIEAGQNLANNEANNKASDERRIIKATKKEIKESRDNYNSTKREIRRNTRDMYNKKISKSLGAEAYLAQKLCNKYQFQSDISIGDVRFMLSEQHKLSAKIDSNKKVRSMNL